MRRLLFSFGVCLFVSTVGFAQFPKLEYGINFGGSVKFIGVDAAGNTYATGVLEGVETYGSTTLSSNGDRDVFVIKVDPAGAVVWAKSFGGPDPDEVYAIDVDAAGNVLIAGDYQDDVDFDPGGDDNIVPNNSDATDGYVLKLDTDGNFVWVSVFGGVEYDAVNGVSTDASSNVFLTGYFAGEADLDPTGDDHLITAAAVDAFFVKLGSDGSFAWAKTVGNGDYANGIGATVDFTGTPIFTGHYYQSLDVDPGTGTETVTGVGTGNDIFMLKLNPADGSFVWGKSIGGDGSMNEANAIYADGQNNIYVTGDFYGTGDFDPGTGERILTAANEFSDAFVAKFHPSGALLWAHAFGGMGDDWAAGIYADGGGNVYVSGTFEQSVDFDPGPGTYLLQRFDQADIFILKLDASSAFKWVAQIGDEEYEEGGAITGDAAGNIYTSGEFRSEPTDVDPSGCELLLDPEIAPSYLLRFGTTPSPCLTIYLHPQDVTTCQGNIVTFTVGASGVNLTYQWFGEGSEGDFDNELTDNAILSGTQTATLTINTANMALGTVDAFVVEVNGDGYPAITSEIVVLTAVGAPDVVPVSRCGPGVVTFKLPDLIPNAEYKWYTVPSGGTPIPGATGPVFTTPSLTTTTTYYVERELGFCQGPRAAVTATIANCQPIPELVWANSIATNGRIADMHVDRTNGTVYVTGYFTGSGGDFDPGPGTTNVDDYGSTDVFIAKYTTAGELLWAGSVGGTSQDDCNAITVDKDGNVLITGYFLNTGDFDPGLGVFPLVSAGSWDTFIVKLDPDGNLLWAKRYGGTPTTGDISSVIRTDASGNVYVGGSFTGTVDMDPGTGFANVTSAGNTDGVILKLDPNGNYISSTILRGASFDSFSDIELDASGNLYATGYFGQNTDFDPGTGIVNETGGADQHAFALKLNSSGGYVWHKVFIESGTQQTGEAVDLDSNGNVIVGGRFRGTIDFDPGSGTDQHAAVDNDGFAIKLDPNGNFIWGRTLPGSTSGFSFTAVNDTDVYMFGSFYSTLDMDPQTGVFNLASAGQGDAHIVKLNQDGDFQWGLQMGGNFHDALMKIAFDDAGNIYTGGWLAAIGDYDPGPGIFDLEPIGSSGASFVKLGAPSPTLLITTQPTSQNACEDGIASFTAEAEGTSNIQYQWQKYNGTDAFDDLVDSDAYSGTATATLLVNTAGAFGAGTYRCVISGDGAADMNSDEVDLTIVTSLDAPTTTDTSRCGPGAIIVNASGTSNGNYRWYLTSTGSPIVGEVTDSYTAAISTTTTYFVSIVSGTCESPKAPVTATVNPIPSGPTTVNVTRCTNTTTTLTASGGTPGGYRWYDAATGGPQVSTSDGFTTPVLTATITYYVSSVSAGCESSRTPITVTVASCNNNQPPVIVSTVSSAGIQGTVTLDLTGLISDPDNNLDFATLRIVVQPLSGATAVIDQNGQLSIDYSATSFEGEDELTIEICDIAGSCAQQVIRIKVSDSISVYNAVSPNGDGKNDILYLEFIDVIEETRDNKVIIFNRWGSAVFEVEDYNNTTNVFSGRNNNGNELPSGTYFYRIEYGGSRKADTGYLSLKR
jgi:gliding motility-associated-like protein